MYGKIQTGFFFSKLFSLTKNFYETTVHSLLHRRSSQNKTDSLAVFTLLRPLLYAGTQCERGALTHSLF